MKSKTKVEPVYEVVAEEGGFVLQRNGRYLMTPAGKPFRLRTAALAEAIAAEWRAQGEKIVPASMPLTQFAATAFDLIAKDRSKTIEGLLGYTDSELLCLRAESPESLAAKQAAAWQPYIDWCAKRYGVVFLSGCGVMPIRQKPEVREGLRGVIEALDTFALTGLSCAADAAGSLLLGLALAEGEGSVAAILAASELDVNHQAIMWGEDPVTQARQAAVANDLAACERWFALLKG